jgi:biopolymer transport protein ExbB
MIPSAIAPNATALLSQEGGSMSLLEYVRAGGSLGYVLIGLSVLAVALIGRNVLAVRRSLLAPPELVDALSRQLRAGDVAGAMKTCSDDPGHSFVGTVMSAAIRRCSSSPMGAFEARAAVEEAGQSATARLQRLNNGLGVLAAVGPMLGLLGTVQGMIIAFYTTANLQAGANRAAELASGIYLALITTFAGLCVAIPAAIIAHYLEGRILAGFRRVDDVVAGLLPAIESFEGRGRTGGNGRPADPSAGGGKV